VLVNKGNTVTILEMFLALVMVISFYIVLLYVWVCVCMYGQLLVLAIQSCGSSALSYVHVSNLYVHIDERILWLLLPDCRSGTRINDIKLAPKSRYTTRDSLSFIAVAR